MKLGKKNYSKEKEIIIYTNKLKSKIKKTGLICYRFDKKKYLLKQFLFYCLNVRSF